jgi:hypothetical protein
MNPAHDNRPESIRRGHGARRPGCRAMRCFFRAEQCGARRSKQGFNADEGRCTQSTQMGPSPVWSFTAATAASHPGEPRQCGSPCPICVFCVHLPSSALNPCLLRRAPHAAATDPGPCAPARTPCTNSPARRRRANRASRRPPLSPCCQNPMHQFPRLPPSRQPSEPETDIIDVLPEPPAPIQAAFSARPDRQPPPGPHAP